MHVMLFSGTGFSREEACVNTLNPAAMTPDAFPAKAGPTWVACSQSHWMRAMLFSGTGFSREEACEHPQFCGLTPDTFPAKAGPTWVACSQFH
jgi:hypothetical protein